MRPQEIIERKRDGKTLTEGEIDSFIAGVVDASWADYQISALLMAMFIRGVTDAEQTFITRAMLNSGTRMNFADVDMPKADKHSTGGVGDKTSLLIAPIVSACGIAVPMISGRALGHTGGTLDKLESIPGYNVRLSFAEIKRVLKKCGFALAGQTKSIAPADKTLYALRDATATVPYIPLIVASIMSKKLAEGLDVLTLDVKTGSGAFIKPLAESRKLARALCATGREFGVSTQALVTDMSAPLGKYAGNGVEVYEAIVLLSGVRDSLMEPTLDLSIELSANMIVQSGIERSLTAARSRARKAVESGEALDRLRMNIELQGGDAKVCDKPDRLLPKRKRGHDVYAAGKGYITAIDALAVGESVCSIGGGRLKASDEVDPMAGVELACEVGTAVEKGDLLATLYCGNRPEVPAASEKLHSAFKISAEKPKPRKLVRARI